MESRADRKLVIVEKDLSYKIIGAFYSVYNELRYGLLESLYANALEIVLRDVGLAVQRECSKPVRFRGQMIGLQRLDMLVEDRIIIEMKATEVVPHAARMQLRSYVHATGLPLGLLLHFGPKANYFRELGRQYEFGLTKSFG